MRGIPLGYLVYEDEAGSETMRNCTNISLAYLASKIVDRYNGGYVPYRSHKAYIIIGFLI